jgi:enamine deaminase RidA (YjgF/YER057c/UK114 family)
MNRPERSPRNAAAAAPSAPIKAATWFLPLGWLGALALGMVFAGGLRAATAPGLQRVPGEGGFAAAVRVPDEPLVYTGQIFASATDGGPAAEARAALDAVQATLAASGSDWSRAVRLTAYVARDEAVAEVTAAVAARTQAAPVAFTLLRTPLTRPGAVVAFEAVATTTRQPAAVEITREGAAILPAGGKIFISGQAQRGTDLASAVKLTMEALQRSVAHLGLQKSDIVQVKAFIKPFADHAAAARAVAASFEGGAAPPLVMLEWESDLFTEIEIVVSARGLTAPAGEAISYAWFPWLTKSPRYSHVGWVAAGTPLIFLSAVGGGDDLAPRAQMKRVFERLGSVLFEAGSSYRNLAKATYYLHGTEPRALLGDIRGVYFDPTRPPAASALEMKSLGATGRAAMVELIAVPAK